MAPMLKDLTEKVDVQIFQKECEQLSPELMKEEQNELRMMLRGFLVSLDNESGDPKKIKGIIEHYRNGEWNKEGGVDKCLLEVIKIVDDPESCEDHFDSYCALIADGSLDKHIQYSKVMSFDILELLEHQKTTSRLITGTFPPEMEPSFAERYHVIAIKVSGYEYEGCGEKLEKGWQVIERIQNGALEFPTGKED